MSPINESRSEHLAELRNAFDESFAAALPETSAERISLVAIRAAGERLALPANQITGIVRPRRIAVFPSRIAESIGLAGIRGTLVPVFSLAALLGLEPRNREAAWLALAHPEAPIALAFEDFEGQVQVERTELSKDESERPRRHVRSLVRIGSTVRAVIEVDSLVEAIRNHAGLARS